MSLSTDLRPLHPYDRKASLKTFLFSTSLALAFFALSASAAFADLNGDQSPLVSGTPVVIQVPPGPCSLINDALAALPEAGGTVQLAEGLYTCQQPVVIKKNNVSLVGAGLKKTLIRAEAGFALPVVIIGEDKDLIIEKTGIPYIRRTVHNISLSGVAIDGNYPGFKALGKDPGKFECFDPKTQSSLTCGKDMGFFIRNNCLTIRHAEHIRVSDVETYHAFSGGIVLEKRNRDIVIDHFIAHNNWFDGFAGYETWMSRFTNFEIYKNIFSGISVDAQFEGNLFDTGSTSFNGDDGVFSHSVSKNVYNNLRIEGNAHAAFFLDGEYDSRYRPVRFVADRCNDTVIENTYISSIGVGLIANHLCKNIQLIDTHIVQPQKKCLTLHREATFTALRSTCGSNEDLVTDTALFEDQLTPPPLPASIHRSRIKPIRRVPNRSAKKPANNTSRKSSNRRK